jgi:hypothetical protein
MTNYDDLRAAHLTALKDVVALTAQRDALLAACKATEPLIKALLDYLGPTPGPKFNHALCLLSQAEALCERGEK